MVALLVGILKDVGKRRFRVGQKNRFLRRYALLLSCTASWKTAMPQRRKQPGSNDPASGEVG